MTNPADILNTLADNLEAKRDEFPRLTPFWTKYQQQSKGVRVAIEALEAAWLSTTVGAVDTMNDEDLDLLLSAIVERRGVLREIRAEQEEVVDA